MHVCFDSLYVVLHYALLLHESIHNDFPTGFLSGIGDFDLWLLVGKYNHTILTVFKPRESICIIDTGIVSIVASSVIVPPVFVILMAFHQCIPLFTLKVHSKAVLKLNFYDSFTLQCLLHCKARDILRYAKF